MYADILSIYQYILICTEYSCCLLSGSQLSERSYERDLVEVGVNVTASRKKRNFKKRLSQ